MTHQPPMLGALHRYALAQGLDDWVGLWLLVDYARDSLGLEGERLRAEVIATIRDLVEAQLMEVGDVTLPGGFRRWGLSSNQAIEELKNRWAPNVAIRIGDVCWLNNTTAGAEVAEKFELEDDRPE